ncbi:hypothetical protein [Billgrantia endophytica]|uniref:hypothetical protein n=1 Tax=Billgrantia endophytica TaxID=2033802 RepID=UPI0013FD4F09|nr:hypothetical protein [Halomonas endophytica]
MASRSNQTSRGTFGQGLEEDTHQEPIQCGGIGDPLVATTRYAPDRGLFPFCR